MKKIFYLLAVIISTTLLSLPFVYLDGVSIAFIDKLFLRNFIKKRIKITMLVKFTMIIKLSLNINL